MGNYNTPVFTEEGFKLLTKVNSGEAKHILRFTKMAIGRGMLPLDSNPAQRTDLIEKIKDIPIISFKISGIGVSEVTGEINNKDIVAETMVFEIGVYAEDPDTKQEILYTYVYTRNTPTMLYPPDTTLYCGDFTIITVIGEANVTANIVMPTKAVHVAFDNKASQLKAVNVQDALDELACSYNLDTLFAHNLNTYPNVLVIEHEYGYGIGGYGETPYGGTISKQIRSMTEYLDRNKIKISLEKEYSPIDIITKVNQNEYVLTFKDSTLSLCVLLFTNGESSTEGSNIVVSGVSSFNGRTGDITLTEEDMPERVATVGFGNTPKGEDIFIQTI